MSLTLRKTKNKPGTFILGRVYPKQENFLLLNILPVKKKKKKTEQIGS